MNLVFDIPFWDEFQWHKFVNLTTQAQEAIALGTSKIFSFPQFACEIFHRLYSVDAIALDKPKPEAAWAIKLHEELSCNQQFQDLAHLVNGNYYSAGLAATSFISELVEHLPVSEEPIADPQELRLQVLGQKRLGDRADTELMEQLIEQGKAAVAAAKEYADKLDSTQSDVVIVLAASKSTKQLQESLDQMHDFFGWDLNEDDSEGIGGSIEEKIKLANKINSSKKLQQIAREAGRLKRVAVTKQRSRTRQARHTIESIECGNDLSRMLPSQAVALTVPTLKPLFLKGYVEKTLLQYKMGGKDRMSSGPLVIVLDSTGSMSGKKEVWSKAVTLTLLGIASNQKRHCRVIHYGDGARRVDDFPPEQKNNSKLLASMEYFYNDGINWEPDAFDSAVECIQKHERYKDADIVFITDGGWGSGSRHSSADSARWAIKFQSQRAKLGFCVYAILVEDTNTCAVEKYVQPDKLICLSDIADDRAIAEVFGI